MVDRLRASVGPLIDDDPAPRPEWMLPAPPPRESWITLQDEIVAVAGAAGPDGRAELARWLLGAVLAQAVAGRANPLSPEAFDLLLDATPIELELNLAPSTFHTRGGGHRFLLEHVWSIPGPQGAAWLSRLARSDDYSAGSLAQAMGRDVRMWTDDEWPDRVEVLTTLHPRPRPNVVGAAAALSWPRTAARAMFKLALVHGVDETDHLVRTIAARLRTLRRAAAADDLDLVDWEAQRFMAPTSVLWLLELMGSAGQRAPLVDAAVASGLMDDETGELMKRDVERPGWADGEVPWTLDDVVIVGDVHLPGGRLGGGDPFLIGSEGGRPSWEIEVDVDRAQVRVVVAAHPLRGRECAALQLVADPDAEVARWTLIRTASGRSHYTVEVGVASVGAVETYASGLIYEQQMDFSRESKPAWAELSADARTTMVLCSVGPQHQDCRTWAGTTDDGRVVTTVTDLGLLDLNPSAGPTFLGREPSDGECGLASDVVGIGGRVLAGAAVTDDKGPAHLG